MNLKNARFALFFLVCFSALLFAKAKPIRVTFTEAIGDTLKLRQVANSFLEPNQLGFSKEETFKVGIRLLHKSSYFSKVDTSTVRGIIVVSLTPAYIVKDIDVKGKFPLFKKDILNALTIRSGVHLSDSLLQFQKKLLENRLKEFGFITPKVVFSRVDSKSTGTTDLTVSIDKDGLYRITSLSIMGDKKYGFFRAFWAKIYSKLWRNGNGYYSEDEINESVDKLLKFYRNYNYYEAKVSCDTYFDDDEKSVSLVLKIDKGPQYLIDKSKKNRGPLNRREVNEFMDMSRKGNRKDFTLKRKLYAIQKSLRLKGYTKAKAGIHDTLFSKKGKPYRALTLDLDLGERVRVASIATVGNLHVPLDTLNQVILTRSSDKIKKKGVGAFSRVVLKQDIEAIEGLYRQKGFPFVVVKRDVVPLANKAVEITIEVEEGERVFVDSLSLTGITEQPALLQYLEKKLPITVGDPFYVGNVFAAADSLRVLLRREGYYDCVVKQHYQISGDSLSSSVTYDIETGRRVTFNRIFFHGNFKTREKLMKRMLNIFKGDIYTDKLLYKGIRRLRDIDNFKTVSYSVPERGGNREKLDLFISVDEKEPYVLGGALGYDAEQEFFGSIFAENKNFLGLNKKLRIEGNLAIAVDKEVVGTEKNYTFTRSGNLQIRYTEPHLFYRDIIASAKIYMRKGLEGEIEDYIEIGNQYNLTWKFSKNFTGFGALSLEARGLNNVKNRRYALEVSPGLSYDRRDSFIRPRKGLVLRANSEVSYGFSHAEDNFVRYTGEAKGYITPLPFLTVASRFGLGVIDLYGGADSLKGDQQFNLGGISSVRGYEKGMLYYNTDVKEDPSDNVYTVKSGYMKMLASIEGRIALPYSFEITTFVDGGMLGLNNDLKSFEKPRFSYGTGLRYVTPVGAIGVLYGRKMKKNITGDDLYYYNALKYKWDFSINYTF